jgi:glutamate 5-kinase
LVLWEAYRLHELGCIPIINENDTVAVDELRFSENDLLAALTCNALRGDALVLLTVVDGLLDGNGEKIDLVDDIDHAMTHTRAVTSRMGKGGMATKLEAAKLVTHAGEIAVIANGRTPHVLSRLFAGEPGVGTVIVPSLRKLDSRRRWIALTKRSSGSVTIDAGAAGALVKGGKSLLPIGVTAVNGTFKKGAALDVLDPSGTTIARGLSNYDNQELNLIKGKRSNQFEKILGRAGYAEVIHRDNLALVDPPVR